MVPSATADPQQRIRRLSRFWSPGPHPSPMPRLQHDARSTCRASARTSPDRVAADQAHTRIVSDSTPADRVRTFLKIWDSDEDIIGFTEDFRLDPADVTAVLDELDQYRATPRPVAIAVDFNSVVTKEQMDRWRRTWNERLGGG